MEIDGVARSSRGPTALVVVRTDRQRAAFERQVRDALNHLYDPSYLQTHPLARLIRADQLTTAAPGGKEIRRVLLDAIESLHPITGGSASERADRSYQILTLRYGEGMDPEEVQARLGISRAAYYRGQKRGAEALADYLWERSRLANQSGTTVDRTAPRSPERHTPADSRLEAARQASHSSALTLGSATRQDELTPHHNLPVQLTSFVGHEREVADVKRLLASTRLLALTGTGGCGKTRLALQVAADLVAEFPGGVVFVPLAPIADPNLVVSTIARGVGVKESADQPLVESLKDALRGHPLLLVLDNFEHVVAAAASVADLLASCPQLRTMVTSRSPLHLRGEHESPVPLLTLPDRDHLPPPEELLAYEAIRLFVERARAVTPDFALTSQNAAAVAAICHHLDGLPLAIELAVARIKVLSPAEILDRLGHRFRILTGGARDLPVRQQTLWNTIAWSYDLLAEGEQQLFRRLSAFTGGCTLDAVEMVGGDLPIDLLDGLTSLVDQSMVRRDETSAEARFAILETIREYGRSLLSASDEEDAIRRRYAGYFLALVDDCVRLQTSAGPGSLTWDSRLEPEQANLRAALAWFRDNDPTRGLRLAAGLGWFWNSHVDLAEGESWLTTFLAKTPGEHEVRGRALLALATIKRDRGDLTGAQSLFEESLARCRQVGDRWGIGRNLGMLGQQARSAGDYERARALAEEALAIAREIGVQDSLFRHLTSLGQFHRLRGDFGRARAVLEEARRLAPRAPFPLYELGLTAEDEGEYVRAEALFQEALALPPHLDWDMCRWLALVGRVTRKQEDPARARRLFEESLALARQNGHMSHACRALYELAVLDWSDSDPVGGHARLVEGLRLAQQGRDRQTLAFGLLLGANHAFEIGAFVRALRLFGAAETVLPGYRFEWDPFDRATYVRSLEAACAALDPDIAASAWAEGQAMTVEQAVARAREEDTRS